MIKNPACSQAIGRHELFEGRGRANERVAALIYFFAFRRPAQYRLIRSLTAFRSAADMRCTLRGFACFGAGTAGAVFVLAERPRLG
jgi:hypothetical protein